MQTETNQSLTPELLRQLAGSRPPCITVAIQTGGNARARLSDAMRQIETGFRSSDPNLPAAVFSVFHDALPSLDKADSAHNLVIVSSPEFQYKFTTEQPVKEIVSVDEEFHLRSLLPLLNRKTEFYILALSQQHTRLLHCTESTSGEVALPPGAPTDFMDFRQTRQPDHVLDNRSSAGPSLGAMKGVLSGSSSDRDEKDRYHHDFYRAIDRGVNAILSGTGMPLAVVAVEHELALYKSVNTYPDFVEPGIHGAPDGLKGGEMHRRALEMLSDYLPPETRRELEHFEKNAGTGHASSHAQEIIKAAYEGRVSHLFLQESAEYRGAFDEVRRKVKHHGDGITPMRDLLNEAVVQTLRNSGNVTLLSAKEMPNGVPVCAVFRYPSAELLAAMKENATGVV